MRILFLLLFFSNFLLGQKLTPKKYHNFHKWGYENEEGENVIHPDYFEANPFEGEFAIVKKTGGYGVINKKGEIVFKCQYVKITHWQNGIFILHNPKKNQSSTKTFRVGLAKKRRKLGLDFGKITYFFENEIRAYNPSTEFTIKIDGEIKSQQFYQVNDIYWGRDNSSLVRKDKWGMIDSSEQIILPLEYDTIIWFSFSQNKFSNNCIAQKKDKWYLVDLNKQPLELQEFDGLEYLRTGEILFRKKNQFGLIALDGSTIDSISWKEILAYKREKFRDKGNVVYELTNKLGSFDQDFIMKIPPIYDQLYPIYYTEFLIAEANDSFGLINWDNQVIIDFSYDSLFYCPQGLRAIKNDKLGIINFQGEIIIPFEYETQTPELDISEIEKRQRNFFPKNYILMQKDGKKCLLDENNNILIPAEYEDIRGLHFEKKIFQVKKNGLWGVLNLEQQWLIPPAYDLFYFGDFHRLVDNTNYYDSFYNRYSIVNYSELIFRDQLGFHDHWFSNGKPKFYDVVFASRNGLTTAFDLTGRQLFPLNTYSENLRVVDYKTDTLIRLSGANKNGVVDIYGQVILDFEYEEVGFYKWDIFLVKKNNKFGLVHRDGTILLPFEFDKIIGQKVLKDGKWGILFEDRKSLKIEALYDEIKISSYSPTCELFVRQKEKWGWYDSSGDEIIPILYDSIVPILNSYGKAKVLVNNKWGIAAKGIEGFILAPEYNEIVAKSWGFDFIKFRKDDKWGIFDSNKNKILTEGWDEVNGRVVRKENYWGIIDEQGELVSELEYEKVNYLHSGKVINVKKNGKWGVVDLDNQTIIDFHYGEVIYSNMGLIKVRRGEKWGLINLNEELILDYLYDEIHFFGRNYLKVRVNDKWGIISKEGKVISKVAYESIDWISINKEFIVKKDGKYGVINLDGSIKINIDYDFISKVGEVYIVKKDGSQGVINSENKIILPIDYHQLAPGKSYIKSIKNGKVGLVNFKGEVILKCKYEMINYDETCLMDGCPIAIKIDSRWGFINFKGKTLIKPQFIYADIFKGNTAKVKDENGNFLINREGKRVSQYYDSIEDRVEESDLIIVSKDNSKGVMNRKGEEVIPIIHKQLLRQEKIHRGFLILFRSDLFHVFDSIQAIKVLNRNNDILISSKTGKPKLYQKGMVGINEERNQWIYQDRFGNQLLPEFFSMEHLVDRYFIVTEKEKRGLFDVIKNEFLVQPIYDAIYLEPEMDKYAFVCIVGQERKYFYIKNQTLHPFQKNQTKQYFDQDERFFLQRINGKTQLLDKNKKEIKIEDFYHGQVFQYHEKENWLRVYQEEKVNSRLDFRTIIRARIGNNMEWITPDGKLFNTENLDLNEIRINKNLILFEGINNSYYGLKLLNGKITFPPTGSASNYDSEGFIYVHDNEGQNGYYFTANHTYKYFEKVQGQSGEKGFPLRWVLDNKKFRFINNKGDFVNELLFDYVGESSEGLIAVEKDEKIGFMNEKGKLVIPLKFETDYSTKNTFKFQEGLAHVIKNGKYGFINKKGETVIPFQYDIAFPVYDGEIVVWENQEWKVLKVKDFMKK